MEAEEVGMEAGRTGLSVECDVEMIALLRYGWRACRLAMGASACLKNPE